jgi:integrase
MRPVARIAQSVEQGIENPRVGGSIPSPGTITYGLPHNRFTRVMQHPRKAGHCAGFSFSGFARIPLDIPQLWVYVLVYAGSITERIPMPRVATPLSDSKCEAAKPREKDYSLFDGEGLLLLVKANGSKTWRFKFKRPDGRPGLATFGRYPALTLKAARERRSAALTLLANGQDPMEVSREKKSASAVAQKHTLKALAIEWHEINAKKWSAGHSATVLKRMETYLFPKLGERSVPTLTTRELYPPIDDAEKQGFHDTASRLRQYLNGIMRLAIRRGVINSNPAIDLETNGNSNRRHRPALALERLPELIQRLSDYNGRPITRLAVELCLHVFVRSSELRFARWSEIDFENAMWRIPAERTPIEKVKNSHRGTKMGAVHLIPLSTQAIDLLNELHQLSGGLELLFPGDHKDWKPMSENTVNAALRRMGYDTKKDVCGHGFRAMACSALTESDLWSKDAVELQMSHIERDDTRAAYTHLAKYLDERRLILQWWSDYLHANRERHVSPFDYARVNTGDKPKRVTHG